MKITIFGASGQIGQLLVQQALEAGHEVTAYIRRPNALTIEHKKLQIIVGSLTDREELKVAIIGRDAVFSALGPSMTMKRQVTDLPITEAHQAIISVMEESAEMNGIEKSIKQSKLDWTVVRIINPNVKTNGNGYTVSFGDTKGKMNVSRYNVAKCMLEAAQKDEWIHKMPIVFNN